MIDPINILLDFDGEIAKQSPEVQDRMRDFLTELAPAHRDVEKRRLATQWAVSQELRVPFDRVRSEDWPVIRAEYAQRRADLGEKEWVDADETKFHALFVKRAQFGQAEQEIVYGQPIEEKRRGLAEADRTGFDLRILQYPGYTGPKEEKKYVEEVWKNSLAYEVQEAVFAKQGYFEGLLAWRAKRKDQPGYSPERIAYYDEVARAVGAHLEETLVKARPVGERAYELIAQARGVKPGEGDRSPLALFRGLSPEAKDAAFRVMIDLAGHGPDKSRTQAFFEAVGRGFENLVEGGGAAAWRTQLLRAHFSAGDRVSEASAEQEVKQDYLAMTMARMSGGTGGGGAGYARMMQKANGRDLTAEEAAEWNRQVDLAREDVDTAEQLRRFGQQVIDPTNHTGGAFFRHAVLPVADSTALLTSMTIPGAWAPAIELGANSYRNDEYARLRSLGMEPHEADRLAGWTSLAQAALDKLQVGILGKALPGTKRMLERFTLRGNALSRWLANTALTTTGETAVELTQDHLLPALVQDNLANDPRFDVRWGEVWRKVFESAPDTALGMLLLSAGGGAMQTWRDGKFVKEFAQNPAAMRVRGYSLEQIREIQEAPEAERGALLAKHLPERAPMGEEQERLLAELKPLLREGRLLLSERVGQEQTAVAEAADYGIRLELKTRGGWVVQMPGGQSLEVSSAEAARRLREDLKQTRTQAEAEQSVKMMESWAQTAPAGVVREVALTGDTVATDGETVTRTDRSGEARTEEVSAQALEELQREGRLVAEAAGNAALELAINGSNFVGRVAEGAKELVQRLEINRSLHGPALTFLHERVEADLKAGIGTGAITWEETRQAVGSLAEAFRPERARSEEERALSERVQKVTRGEASETELRETLVELAVGDIIGRRRDGSVMPAGSVTAALDAAVRATTEVSHVKALGKFRTFLRAVRTYLRGVFRTAAAIGKTRREGRGEEFTAMVDRLLGTDGQGFDFKWDDFTEAGFAETTFALRESDKTTLEETRKAVGVSGHSRAWAELPFSEAERQKVNQLSGVDVTGYRRVVDASALRHVENRHGESSNDPHPITEDDIRALPEIVSALGATALSPSRGKNTTGVVSVRYHNGAWYYYVEEIRPGSKALALASIRKAPAQTNTAEAASYTSETLLREAEERLQRALDNFNRKGAAGGEGTSYSLSQRKDKPNSWQEVKPGHAWNSAKKHLPRRKDPRPGFFLPRGSWNAMVAHLAQWLNVTLPVKDAWGDAVVINNPQKKGKFATGLENRAAHLLGMDVTGNEDRVLDADKVVWIGATLTTIQTADVRVVSGNEIYYYRWYAEGVHMVIVEKNGNNYALVSQYPVLLSDRKFAQQAMVEKAK